LHGYIDVAFIAVNVLVHHGSLELAVARSAGVIHAILIAAVLLMASVIVEAVGMVLSVLKYVHMAHMVHTASITVAVKMEECAILSREIAAVMLDILETYARKNTNLYN
jgi:hypothetical protein